MNRSLDFTACIKQDECPECGTKVKLFVNFTAFAEEFEDEDEDYYD